MNVTHQKKNKSAGKSLMLNTCVKLVLTQGASSRECFCVRSYETPISPKTRPINQHKPEDTVGLQLGAVACFTWLIIQPCIGAQTAVHMHLRHTECTGEYTLSTLLLSSWFPPPVIVWQSCSISLSHHTKTSHPTPLCLACFVGIVSYCLLDTW